MNYVERIRKQVGHEPIFLNGTAAVICNQSGEILMQRRGGGEKADSWSIPGGIMEIGERPQETIIREVGEETGLKIEVRQLIGVYTSPKLVEYPNGDTCQMVTQVFTCEVVDGQLIPDGEETLELKYFPRKERPRLFREHLERALQDYEAGRLGISD